MLSPLSLCLAGRFSLICKDVSVVCPLSRFLVGNIMSHPVLRRQNVPGGGKGLHTTFRGDHHHRHLHRHLGLDARRRRRSRHSLAKIKDEGDGLVRDVIRNPESLHAAPPVHRHDHVTLLLTAFVL